MFPQKVIFKNNLAKQFIFCGVLKDHYLIEQDPELNPDPDPYQKVTDPDNSPLRVIVRVEYRESNCVALT